MNRKKSLLTIFIGLLVSLPVWRLYHDVEQRTKDRALRAAIKTGDNAKILTLLADGADVEARNNGKPSDKMLLLIIDHFRHPDALPDDQATDDEHLPALLLLYEQAFGTMPEDSPGPDLAVVRALLDHGAQVNERNFRGANSLGNAAWFSNCDTIRLFLAYGADIEAKDAGDATPLIGADAGVTAVLIEHGANIEAKDVHQTTPLLQSVIDNKFDVVRLLLEHGANIEARDGGQYTPLMWATSNTNPDIVRLLLKHGALVSPRDGRGRTALDFIRKSKRTASRRIITLLCHYGAK